MMFAKNWILPFDPPLFSHRQTGSFQVIGEGALRPLLRPSRNPTTVSPTVEQYEVYQGFLPFKERVYLMFVSKRGENFPLALLACNYIIVRRIIQEKFGLVSRREHLDSLFSPGYNGANVLQEISRK